MEVTVEVALKLLFPLVSLATAVITYTPGPVKFESTLSGSSAYG